MRRLLPLLMIALLAGCEADVRSPIGRPEVGPARFGFLSSWEPSIEKREYVNVVGFSFALKNDGGRPGTPFCEIISRDESLFGWSQAPEIDAGAEGRVEGEAALLPPGTNPNSVLTHLEPACREATGNEPWTGVPKRFFGAEGDRAFFELKQQGFQLDFGPAVSATERQNIRGHRTHPEVVLTDLRLQPGTKIITLKDVDCVGREEDLC